MAEVRHYQPDNVVAFPCQKGGFHAEQSLNVVCLDPLCLNDPLGCSICFSQTHKYHKVVSIQKFIDDYSRNAGRSNATFIKKVESEYRKIRSQTLEFKAKVMNQLDEFLESTQQYVNVLKQRLSARKLLTNQLGVPVQPSMLNKIDNEGDLTNTIKLILRNSTFDKAGNMYDLQQVLKQQSVRVQALLDKLSNMTKLCKMGIEQAMLNLNFSKTTAAKQQIQLSKDLADLAQNQDLRLTLQQFDQIKTDKIVLNYSSDEKSFLLQYGQNMIEKNQQKLFCKPSIYRFGTYKHENLQLINKAYTVKSNITALKPQFALICPTLCCEPLACSEWALRIKNCRNFSTKNTLAIGVGKLQDIKKVNFEGEPNLISLLMVTSQGWICDKGAWRKGELIFGDGDSLYLKYDPFYGMLEIEKNNGRKLTLHLNSNQDLFAFVRLTYASDEVELIS